MPPAASPVPAEHQVDDHGLAQRIQQVFDRFDKDGGGSLDRTELQSVFKTLCPSFTSKQITQYVHELDRGGDGSVSHSEFIHWIKNGSGAATEVYKMILKETGDAMSARVREVFQRFDSDGGGYLDRDELARVFRTLNSDFTFKDVDVLCKDLDRGGDGKVSHKEFLHWLKKGNDLTQAVTRAILRETGEARDERIKKAFQTYDATGDGSLNIEELRKALKVLGTFSEDEVKKICADLDKSKDGEVSYAEFAAWIKAGHGPKEAMKAKAILAPADNDGLEAVFYNFCGVGHSDMDGKGFKKLCQDCSLMDKKLDTTTVDLIFADNRVKPRGTNRIDFYQFEIALELVAEKKAVSKTDVRSAMIAQGTPKTVNATSTNPTLKARPKDNARLVSEKRIAAILRRSPRELGKNSWKKEIDNTELWKVFGLDSKAGRILKRVYTNPVQQMSASASSRMRTPQSSRMRSPASRGRPNGQMGGLSGMKEEQIEDLSGSLNGSSMKLQ